MRCVKIFRVASVVVAVGVLVAGCSSADKQPSAATTSPASASVSPSTAGSHGVTASSGPRVVMPQRLATDPAVFGDQVAVSQTVTGHGLDPLDFGPCRDQAAQGADSKTITGHVLGDRARQAYIDAGLPREAAEKMHWAASGAGADTAKQQCEGQIGRDFQVVVGLRQVGENMHVMMTVSLKGSRDQPPLRVDNARPMLTAYVGENHRPVPISVGEFREDANPDGSPLYQWTSVVPVKDLGPVKDVVLRTDTGFLPEWFNVFTFYRIHVTT